jgi:hypothetical protein
MTHLETTSRELAEALTELIDSSHGAVRAACMALAAGIGAASEGSPGDGDTLAQHVGNAIHVSLVGERLLFTNSANTMGELQDGLWQTWCQMVDWEAVGQHYLQEFHDREQQ